LPNIIKGKIEVTTQYEYFLDINKSTRTQDIRLDHEDITYIEFQNKANTTPPVKTRAIEYFSLGIGHSKGKISNQIWLLAEDIKELLHGEIFTNYILKDTVTGNLYPNNSSILFVSLQQLSKQNNEAGELSKFLLDEKIEPSYKEVIKIIESFSDLFYIFKEDKEVRSVITVKERFKNEGIEQGIEYEKFTISKNLLSLKIPLKQISIATGLDIETLIHLKEEAFEN
jgi:hypothetical protein